MSNLIVMKNELIVPKAKELGIKVFKSRAEIENFISLKIKSEGADALRSMMDGNERHVNKITKHNSDRKENVVNDFIKNGQKPFCTLLSCSDSRLKISRMFDKKDGKIFSIKNAGNIAYDPVTIGTSEYGIKHLETPILMVLGHEFCGAVSATCSHHGHVDPQKEGSISFILEKIGHTAQKVNYDIESTILLNIFDTIDQIRANSNIIVRCENEGKVDIVAAYYSLTTGHVFLLDK